MTPEDNGKNIISEDKEKKPVSKDNGKDITDAEMNPAKEEKKISSEEETGTPAEEEKKISSDEEKSPSPKPRRVPLEFPKIPKPGPKTIAVIAVIAVILIACGIGAYIGYNKYNAYNAHLAQVAEDDAHVKYDAYNLAIDTFHEHAVDDVYNGTGEDVADALIGAGLTTLDGIHDRPPFVEITDANRDHFASVNLVEISPVTGMVEVSVTADALPISDDGYYYLFSEAVYENSISGEPIVRIEKDVDFTVSCALNYNSADSRLFDKFCMALLIDDEYVKVSNAMYITNPEAKASYASSRDGGSSKKGLLVNPDLITSGQLEDLGCKHAAYNIYTSLICNGGGISYTYNGHTYNFNAYQVSLYDLVFTRLTSRGVDVNAIIINDLSNSTITYPGSRGGRATLYAFNTADEEGVNYVAAVASFLANRYSGASGHGKVSNWIIGNEVNERVVYNYTPSMGVEPYAHLYADTIRVFYNAMCAVNSTTRVYVSLDNRWNMNKSDSSFYDVKDLMDAFNSYMRSEGNIDWHVGYHPYNYPLTAARAWHWGSKFDGMAGNSSSTAIISMRNIHVLTDYLSQSNYLDRNGNVRRVILSEMGYTSSQGQELQAASFAYAYKVMEANSHIDYMLLSRQIDAGSEVAEGLALGILNSGGGRKEVYNVFKAAGTGDEATVFNKYLGIIGISSWSQIQNAR